MPGPRESERGIFLSPSTIAHDAFMKATALELDPVRDLAAHRCGLAFRHDRGSLVAVALAMRHFELARRQGHGSGAQ
jgi:hypothetical protein